MEKDKIIITPKTRVGELLDCYPGLETVLMQMSPAFEKLKNPLLRKTVARVATLAQVAVVGGLKVEDIVNRLRKETGQDEEISGHPEADYILSSNPSWFNSTMVKEIYDATSVINSGESPMNSILSKSHHLKEGEILEIHTPFIPAPVIDKLKEAGFRIYCISENNTFKTRIVKYTGIY